jgi:EpsI family protein
MPDVLRFAPIALLGAGCLLISGLREQQRVPAREKMSAIMVDAPGYKTEDVVVGKEEQRVAGMDDYQMRTFQRDSLDPGFSTYVGYYTYQVQGKTIHSPRNCLPGAGWEQLSFSIVPLAVAERSVPINRYVLGNKGAQALVYYWYQGRGRVEASEYKVKWNLLRDAALHGRTEEALVRIVLPVAPEDLQAQRGRPNLAPYDSQAFRIARQLVPKVEAVLPAAPGSA